MSLTLERIKKLELIGMIFEIKKNVAENMTLCEKYGINYYVNKKIIDYISHKEFGAKINYLISLGIKPMIDYRLHPIFFMSDLNMQVTYGISLEELINMYSIQKDKVKKI